MRKSRGKLLLILIVLALLSNIITLHSILNADFLKQIYGEIPKWFRIYESIDLLLGIVAVIGIWFWKSWAVFILRIHNYFLLSCLFCS